MIVYIDTYFKCHINFEPEFTKVEVPFFDGKCSAFVEGYRFIPNGQTWIREDGVEFTGEMITPWKSYEMLESIQKDYDTLINEFQESYVKGVNSV